MSLAGKAAGMALYFTAASMRGWIIAGSRARTEVGSVSQGIVATIFTSTFVKPAMIGYISLWWALA